MQGARAANPAFGSRPAAYRCSAGEVRVLASAAQARRKRGSLATAHKGFRRMDGSRSLSATEGSDATRVALKVDRDALGLMKHASQLSHLVEWWLQGSADALNATAAFRIGRRLERFRLAARLAEGKSSNQVKLALEGLRAELMLYPVPEQLQAELDAAQNESARMKAGQEQPPTLVREALTGEPLAPTETPAPRPKGPRTRLFWLTLALAASGAAWWSNDGSAVNDLLHKLLQR